MSKMRYYTTARKSARCMKLVYESLSENGMFRIGGFEDGDPLAPNLDSREEHLRHQFYVSLNGLIKTMAGLETILEELEGFEHFELLQATMEA